DPQDGQVATYNATLGKWINADPPAGGGGGGAPTGSAYPAGAAANDQFTRLDTLEGAIFRDDLPIKRLTADVAELDGWIGQAQSNRNFRRTDIIGGGQYVVGDGYSGGVYFAQDSVISRFDVSFGTVLTAQIGFRTNTNTSGSSLEFAYTWDVDTKTADSVQPWVYVPAGTTLSIHVNNLSKAAPEINAALEWRSFAAPTPDPV
ncbi:MAG: hypothetical protein AAGG01_12235, partial [Planctomycetota bacterium]